MPSLRNSARPKGARVECRLYEEEKALLLEAALLSTNGDLTRFIKQVSLAAAEQVVNEHGVTRMEDAERRRVYDLLLNPPKPSQALVDLFIAEPDGFVIE